MLTAFVSHHVHRHHEQRMRPTLDRRMPSPQPQLHVIGLSHRTTPVELREQFAIRPQRLQEAIALLRAGHEDEVVMLSTCNRTELYVATADSAAAFQRLLEFMTSWSRLPAVQFQSQLYQFSGAEAATHLFRVAAGLDSMVLGESEIIAQVKQAYLAALSHGATGPVLNALFQKALHAAKAVRARTELGHGQASIGSVVVSLARQDLRQPLSQSRALVWGAGKAAETTTMYLRKAGIGQLTIVSRTPAKSQALALRCDGGWASWEQALAQLADADLAVICTQAPHYVLDEADLAGMSPRRQRSLLIIDLAVPRNVAPSLACHEGVRLYDIDDLHALAKPALARREQSCEAAEAILQEQVQYAMRRWTAAPSRPLSPAGASRLEPRPAFYEQTGVAFPLLAADSCGGAA